VSQQDCSPAPRTEISPLFLATPAEEQSERKTDPLDTPLEEIMRDEGYSAALSFFRAVETDPMTDEANDIADMLVDEYGPDEILRGLAIVAAVMRKALRDHANGCDCGSDAWLDRAIYANAALDGHDG
jgi:hypothetical protein